MTVVLSLYGGRPKGDILDLAFEEIGIADSHFERSPEEEVRALKRLNMLMAEDPWSRLDYAFPIHGHGSAAEESGLPDSAISAVAYELARRMLGFMGGGLLPEQRKAAADAKAQAIPVYVPTALMAPGTVRGSGGRPRYSSFITESE